MSVKAERARDRHRVGGRNIDVSSQSTAEVFSVTLAVVLSQYWYFHHKLNREIYDAMNRAC